ncbi:MAG: hypothetical protein AAFZ65_16080, partial [Planctomycetota bacterium]
MQHRPSAPHSNDASPSSNELSAALTLVRRNLRLLVLFFALGASAGVFWLSRQDPVYRATATLLLDDQDSAGGVLGELASLSRSPAATSEIALLESRSLAEATVRAPRDGSIPTPDNPAAERHQGLATTVEDPGRQPLRAIVGRLLGWPSGGQLYARVVDAETLAPPAFAVRFLGQDRIRVTPLAEGFTGLTESGEAVEIDYVPGRTIECAGVRLKLEPQGDLTGQRRIVHRRSESLAVRGLLGSTRVVETKRDSGVIAVTVDDSDPNRAAAIANALCRNYFDLNVERNQRRASQTVEFIEEQLDEQLAALERAELEVVSLQSKSADSIDVVAAAEGLIGDLSDLAVQRMELELQRSSLEESVSLLESGDYGALSRLSGELDDPLSTSLLEQLEMLHMEQLLDGRPASHPYAMMLESRARELRGQVDELTIQINALRETVNAIDDGRPGAYASIGEDPALGVVVDPLTRGYLGEVSRLESERDALIQEFKPEYPPLVRIEERLTDLRQRIKVALVGRLDGLASLRDDRILLADRAEEDSADLPADTREITDGAVEELRARVATHLANRLAAVRHMASELDGFNQRLEERLGALPERQRQLSSPLRRLETHKEIAAFLMKSLQEAEITRASTVASADFIDPAVAPRSRS